MVNQLESAFDISAEADKAVSAGVEGAKFLLTAQRHKLFRP